MISGRPQRSPRRALLCALPILLNLSFARAAEPVYPIDRLLGSLAQPTPASTTFIEQRESNLLSESLILHGRLEQPDAETLIRVVDTPYRERSTIRAERVELEREGERTRRFALRRAPELGALLDAFRALIGGERALFERHYLLQLAGDVDAAWQLVLTPREQRRKQRFAGIDLYGQGAVLHCLVVRQVEGGASRMLLGPAAVTADAATDARFDTLCGLSSPAP